MHSVKIDGHECQYWTYGTTDGHPLVMIHGFRGTHHGLEKLADELTGFHTIIPDLPGFGESTPLEKHSLENYIAWLSAFIEALDLSQKPILLGHSFGSIIASHFAAESPISISQLILINPIGAPALKGPQAALTQAAIFYYFIGRLLPDHLSRRWLGNVLFVDTMSRVMTKSREKTMRHYIKQQHRTHFSSFASSSVVAEAFKASVSHDVREVAAKLTTPTLLIAGQRDDVTTVAKQHELANEIPDGSLKVIDDVGHLIHYETAHAAADLIQAWTRAEANTRR